ncbi:MAG: cupin domain-containing protein [Candidatus Magasanikbacteria bacterium]
MRKIDLNPKNFFQVLEQTERSQVAEMVLSPGQSTGGPNNQHPDSDQWLYVMEGEGEAVIDGEAVKFSKEDLLLIEAGENHEIRNTGEVDLETFNIYAPKAY